MSLVSSEVPRGHMQICAICYSSSSSSSSWLQSLPILRQQRFIPPAVIFQRSFGEEQAEVREEGSSTRSGPPSALHKHEWSKQTSWCMALFPFSTQLVCLNYRARENTVWIIHPLRLMNSSIHIISSSDETSTTVLTWNCICTSMLVTFSLPERDLP